MRDYARIAPQFWSGDTGRRLRGDPDALVLAFYLMTCPSSTMSGLFYLPLPTIAHETGLSVDDTRRAFARLEAEDFARYDESAEVVWVPEMARCQVGVELAPGDNRIKGLVREVERYRRSRFYAAFFARYGAAYHLLPQPAALASNITPLRRGSQGSSQPGTPTVEGPSKVLRRGPAGDAKPLRSQDQDQDQEQDQEQEQETVAPASPPRPPDGEPKGKADEATEPGEPTPPLFRLEPIATNGPQLSRPDEALQLLAEASNARFVTTKLKRGQAIYVQKLIAAHPDAADWLLVGEWLAAGGEAWRTDLDARSLSNFEAWLAHASKWRDTGRPPLQGRGARAPTAVGWAPATAAYERSEDLTDDL